MSSKLFKQVWVWKEIDLMHCSYNFELRFLGEDLGKNVKLLKLIHCDRIG